MSMVSGISQNSSAVDLAQSIDALAAVLRNSSAQSMQLAEKLLRIGAQQAIQDSSVGARVDTSA
jgi:hypothetical protein